MSGLPSISWIGPLAGYGAFPTIGRHMVGELQRRGYTVLENMHNDGSQLTDIAIHCEYPPQPLRVKHPRNICIATWEFHGPSSTPRTFLDAFEDYDKIWAMCNHAAMSFWTAMPADKVAVGRLGVDPVKPDHEAHGWAQQILPAGRIVLVVGGSDPRHGMDIAEKVAAELPDDCTMVWKMTPGYPEPKVTGRIRIISESIRASQMAALYERANCFLYPVRAAAPGLPMIEAISYGLPVAATEMPAANEVAGLSEYMRLVPARFKPMRHHIHDDCEPWWWEPSPDGMIVAVNELLQLGRIPNKSVQYYRYRWSWERAVDKLEESF